MRLKLLLEQKDRLTPQQTHKLEQQISVLRHQEIEWQDLLEEVRIKQGQRAQQELDQLVRAMSRLSKQESERLAQRFREMMNNLDASPTEQVKAQSPLPGGLEPELAEGTHNAGEVPVKPAAVDNSVHDAASNDHPQVDDPERMEVDERPEPELAEATPDVDDVPGRAVGVDNSDNDAVGSSHAEVEDPERMEVNESPSSDEISPMEASSNSTQKRTREEGEDSLSKRNKL